MILVLGVAAPGQDTFELRPAEPIALPVLIDSNTPSFWAGSSFRFFSAIGEPMVSTVDETIVTQGVSIDRRDHFPMWIESVWDSGDGTLYAWYHHEHVWVCQDPPLNRPDIGALVSYDGGLSFQDLGIVLSSGTPDDCSAQNGYFAAGHGDFSVILDREGQFFYFLFGSYGGDRSEQGIAIARMSIDDVAAPVGTVWKYHAGEWSEPGLGGRVTPIFPATVAWQAPDTDSFWGPSVHWNTHLRKYVVLMNRSCCDSGWPQEGVYLTMNADIGNPASWTVPVKIMDGGDWYPWVLGLGPRETSSDAGQVVRLFVRNVSEWELVFGRTGEESAAGYQEPYIDGGPGRR